MAAAADQLALFRSPTAGALLALVADHLVHGRVVFPGAAHLETARAACAAISSAADSAAISNQHPIVFKSIGQ